MLKIYSNEHIQFPNEKKTGTRTLTKSNCKIIQKPFLVIFFFISTLRDIFLSGCWTNHLRIQKTTCLFFRRLLARGFLFQNVIQFLFSFSKRSVHEKNNFLVSQIVFANLNILWKFIF